MRVQIIEHDNGQDGPSPTPEPDKDLTAVYENKLQQSTDHIRALLKGRNPEVGLILGSGLGGIANKIEDPIVAEYSDIVNFPVTSNPQHAGLLVSGEFAGRQVIGMSGRAHMHEGNSALTAAFQVRALALLGVKNFVITNAAGLVHPDFQIGDIMFLTNHTYPDMADSSIGLRNSKLLGNHHYDATWPYDMKIIEQANCLANEAGLTPRIGSYRMTIGPAFESAAQVYEIRLKCEEMLRREKPELAPCALGMSTVPEVLALQRMKTVIPDIRILAFSFISNFGAGLAPGELTDEDVQVAAAEQAPKLEAFADLLVRLF